MAQRIASAGKSHRPIKAGKAMGKPSLEKMQPS
jgi:hypothetical protein